MIDLVNIKNKRLEYPDAINQEFLTLEEYHTLTLKLVKVFASGTLRRRILQSEDAISNIAHEIMMADWRWNEEHLGTESGKCFSRSSYRIECAKYAIYGFAKRESKNKYQYFADFSEEYEESIPNTSTNTPLDLVCHVEETNQNFKMVDSYLKSDLLSDKEEACLRLYYYNNKTYKEIGQTLGVCRERIRQIVDGALTKLRNNNETRLSERKERRIKSN